MVRLQGTSSDPSVLNDVPIVTGTGMVPLGSIAELTRTREEPTEPGKVPGQTRHAPGDPPRTRMPTCWNWWMYLNEYLDNRNRFRTTTGVELVLADDQTVSTREALTIMQTNALIGLFLVLLVTWLFLGTRISFLTTIGIPFTLCGTFLVLNASGFTLNNTVLLGVVIVLGMIG